MIAPVDVRAVARARLDRETNLDGASGDRPRDVEAGVLEDPQHRAVLVEHLGHEALDAGRGCGQRELLEQTGADAPALHRVLDGEGGLRRPRVAEAYPARDGHDTFPAGLGEGADQRLAFHAVRLEEGRNEGRPDAGKPVKAEIQALLRQPGEEVEYRVGLHGLRRMEPQRRPVAEDDVPRLPSLSASEGFSRHAGWARRPPDSSHGRRTGGSPSRAGGG